MSTHSVGRLLFVFGNWFYGSDFSLQDYIKMDIDYEVGNGVTAQYKCLFPFI